MDNLNQETANALASALQNSENKEFVPVTLDAKDAQDDLASSSNLLEGSETVQDVQVKAGEPLTEVTSIAKEEEKTGQKIDLPSPEELVARASSSVIANLQTLNKLINMKQGSGYAISRKGMNRLLLSIFDLPTEGQQVKLQGKEEKYAFFVGQNLMRSLFILMQNHVNEEIAKRKLAELEKTALATETKEEVKPSEGENNEPKQ